MWYLIFISTSWEPPVNRKDLQALTLAGPTRNQLVLIALAPRQPTIYLLSHFSIY